jgi:hypothetical protein
VSQIADQVDLKGDRGVLVLKQTLGSDILQALFQFLKLAETHPQTDEIFKKATQDLLKGIQIWVSNPDFGKLKFSLSGDQIYFNEVRIRPKPRYIDKIHFLLSFFRKRRLNGFTVEKVPTPSQLETFLWAVHETTAQSAAGLEEDLKSKGLTDFTIESLIWKKDGSQNAQTKSLATVLYDQFYDFVTLVTDDFKKALETEPPPLTTMFDSLQTIDETDLTSLFCLRVTTRGDRPLSKVAVNTSFMIFAWARGLGLPPGVLTELAGAGLAHPLILTNMAPGISKDVRSFERISLAFSNFEQIKKVWPLTDLQVLALLEWSIPFGKNGVYEMGGQKCYQHFFSRMLRIVALYQQQLIIDKNITPEMAVAKLLSPQMGCDQTLVRLFVHWIGICPIGSFVELESGEIGQICSLETNLLSNRRPKVGIFKDKAGVLLETPQIIDLAENQERPGIKRSLIAAEADIPSEKIALLNSLSANI